jgi:hypothetical protein
MAAPGKLYLIPNVISDSTQEKVIPGIGKRNTT